VPDSPTTLDPEPPKPEADELAKGLPGLPVETKRLRADERGVLVRPGFLKRWRGRSEELIPWSEIVGYRSAPSELLLERQRSDECEVHLVRAWAGRSTRRAIAAAWREYVLRKIELDGCLRGTHFMIRPKLQYLTLLILGSLFLAQSIWMIALPVIGTVVPAEMQKFLPIAGTGLLLLALAMILCGLREKRLTNEALLHWYHWEITREGIVHWPFTERTLLAATKEDSIMSGWGRISGATVPFAKFTCRRVAERLVLARLDKAGAQRPFLGWLAASEAALTFVLFYCAAIPVALAETTVLMLVQGVSEPQPVVAFPVASVLAIMVSRAWSRRRTRRAIAEGRAMLERLGW